MTIRHVTEWGNLTDELWVKDPTKARHCQVKDGRIHSLAHLNLDYPYHRMTTCIVTEECGLGSKVILDQAGFLFVGVRQHDFRRLGNVDLTQSMLGMRRAYHKLQREKAENVKH